jgi:sulfate/thiosulfate transport system permease protein
MTMRRKSRSVLPGFGLSLGITCTYLSLMVLLPLATVFTKTTDLSWAEFWGTVTNPRVMASYRVTFGASFVAALVNTVFGLLVAWVLVRYRFPGRKLVDALVDLPFALPTAVAGIALTTLYAGNGWVGSYLEPLGIKVSYTWLGITVALIFIGLPFVVRTVQPVLETLERDVEEAAASLGAGRGATFRRVILPSLVPAIAAGAALSFARGISEYGSLVLLSGNLPNRTEVASVRVLTYIENGDQASAASVAVILLVVALVVIVLLDVLQRRLSGVHA